MDTVTLAFAGGEETADYAALTREITKRLGAPVQYTNTTTTWRRDDSDITLSKSPGGGVVLSESV